VEKKISWPIIDFLMAIGILFIFFAIGMKKKKTENAGKMKDGFDILNEHLSSLSSEDRRNQKFSMYSGQTGLSSNDNEYVRKTGGFILNEGDDDYEDVPIIDPLMHFHENFQQLVNRTSIISK
jgi:hypothetical protein